MRKLLLMSQNELRKWPDFQLNRDNKLLILKLLKLKAERQNGDRGH